MPTGIELIAQERDRQRTEEGYSDELDDYDNISDEMAMAASCYALPTDNRTFVSYYGCMVPTHWPWAGEFWKPKDRLRDLVRAGALIAAEIDRLQRVTDD